MKKIQMRIILYSLIVLSILPIVMADTMLDSEFIDGIGDGLLNTEAGRISLIFPAVLLIISIITVMIDFGAVGVILGCMGSLVIVVMLGIVALSWSSIISFLLLGGLLIFKVTS
jgi:hypothetical protein